MRKSSARPRQFLNRRGAVNIMTLVFILLSILLFAALPAATARFLFFGTPIWDPLMWFAAGPYVLPATIGQFFNPRLEPGNVFPLMVSFFLGWHIFCGWLLRKLFQHLVVRGVARSHVVLGLIVSVWVFVVFVGFVQYRLREPAKIAVSLQETIFPHLRPGMTVSEIRDVIPRWLYVDTYAGYKRGRSGFGHLDGFDGGTFLPERNVEEAARAIPLRTRWTADGEEWMERCELLFDKRGRLLCWWYVKYPVVHPGFHSGRIDYDAAARALQEALVSVPLPEGARLAIVLSEPHAKSTE